MPAGPYDPRPARVPPRAAGPLVAARHYFRLIRKLDRRALPRRITSGKMKNNYFPAE
jgi:hypothetical protein